ncbi:Murein DD-endopeptidase MepM and murein hydrolase activator NlpD, contain LysM domain [Roseivivax halotolerans]|uniref:Murein DD-endopeptidase MepM and murein hydrolase activator NlpD, contain LysM domain n=1 Tax=Roseivivax halotolerans TaxID=93684 RepID=A0A1I5Z618_9RHOB|nr:LysM peptidoglycan-binding domain-containing M23 family metallopeptidase [Roseivivax halotolerans]SFQ51890.1 Murein DD-endopeptidase MepM and murein hydrolase activator NlpD, contain LysM domain [Roseivivax halotolerans]
MADRTRHFQTSIRTGGLVLTAFVLAACEGPLDIDMRPGDANTTNAAVNATADRPAPDSRGVISYPTYQVAVARRGDTLATLAQRVGVTPASLARYNGIEENDPLRAGEVVALPNRVSEPSGTNGGTDIASLANNAINSAAPTPITSGTLAPAPGGAEPVRHQVERGETAYTIARLYNVTPRALAEWNGLDQNYTVREGQYLLIPTSTAASQAQTTTSVAEEPVAEPGQGSPTPTPPSAAQPLPPAPTEQTEEDEEEEIAAAAPTPDVGQVSEPQSSGGAFMMPVSGSVIREYAPGTNDGIDIAAPAGTSVKAAASGTVAAITTNTDGIPILVIKHPDNILTVYTHIDGISVSKGDAVSRGQSIAKVRAGDPARMHFEVRDGFDAVDPNLYLN